MEIRKEYNVQELAEKLKEEIDNSKRYNGVVKLDVRTTLEILDVLLETHRREQKHQTIESALMFGEKEVETRKLVNTQQNVKPEYKKELKESKIPSCFGNYEEEDDWEDSCDECMYEKECKKNCMNKKKQREDICVNE